MVKSLGIDIGSSSIKVVEAVTTARGVTVTSFREFPLGVNPAFDQTIEIHDILRDLAGQVEAGRTRVVVGLRQEYLSCRLRLFPFVERSKILKSLPFELEEELPFSSETAIYDARVTQIFGSQAEVLAVVAAKSRIASLLQQLKDTGLELTLVSAEGLALANCFERWNDVPPVLPALPEGEDAVRPRRRLHARLHIGHSHSVVLAFEENHLLGVRSILWGAKNVAEAISRRYEIPYIEAVSEMRKKAFILTHKGGASYDQILFSDTIASQLKDLGQELKFTLSEFQSELHGEISGLEMTGPFSQTLNLNAAMTQILEIPVNRSNFLSQFEHDLDKSSQTEATLAVALGLALEGLRRPKNPPIQFLRAEFAKQGEGLTEVWKKWGVTVQFVASMFLIFVFYANLRDSFAADLVEKVQDALKKQAKQVAGLTGKQGTETNIRKYIANQRKRVKDVKEIENALHMNAALDVLKRISDLTLPHNKVTLTIRKLEIQDTQVQMEGQVAKAEEAHQLESAFKGMARGPVQLSVGNPVAGQTTVSFTMVFHVDRGLVVAK
ncbi:MAG: pilus assembly protein PilM [Bdellovibrio sp.]|nr:MAG: pilus assembly protein PilM [Bdellovibrio sp.]